MPLSERSSMSAHVQVGPRATVIRISTRPRVRRFFGASLVERTSCTSWPLGHNLITQATGECDPCLIRALPHRELPGPPPDRILAPHRVHGDFHQRKAQPRRTFAGDPAAPIPVRAGLDAWDQPRITGQGRTAGKAVDVANLGAQRQREHRPYADHRVETTGDRISGRSRPHGRIGDRGFGVHGHEDTAPALE
jgi:hypothetical protein